MTIVTFVLVFLVVDLVIAVVISIIVAMDIIGIIRIMGVFYPIGGRRKAAQLYKEAGRSPAAAEALSKAAKLIEDKNPQVCI